LAIMPFATLFLVATVRYSTALCGKSAVDVQVGAGDEGRLRSGELALAIADHAPDVARTAIAARCDDLPCGVSEFAVCGFMSVYVRR
jgi:hypothetical protein